ncbi:MAG: 4a-hydroxytetrahydrobiopterin dehydratase [Chloroflexota bacterium]|nr:4a-hydroxytetrahydrobiopterin dehydratase [Chloroflexota bacterium]
MPYAEPLTDAELAAALRELPEWTSDGATIRRAVKLADFRACVALVNAVADAAEAANHHPDICLTGYRNVSFELSTHAAKALTRRDIELATEIDRLIIGAA